LSLFEPGVLPATRRALRQGRLRPQATLDLHGCRAAEVPHRVEAFLHEARASGHRCVLLITGRGLRSGAAGPVLRDLVVRLLTQARLARGALGVVSAPPALGGVGALVVLLRKG
jgi:DNA-nicking Smr family endonuclease